MPINWNVVGPSTPGLMANSFDEGRQELARNALLAAQLQHVSTGNQVQQYTLAQAQRADNAQNALSAAYSGALDPSTGQVNEKLLYQRLAGGGAGHMIPDVQAKLFKMKSDVATLDKTKAETLLKQNEAIGQRLSMVSSDDHIIPIIKDLSGNQPGQAESMFNFYKSERAAGKEPRQIAGELASSLNKEVLAKIKAFAPDVDWQNLGGTMAAFQKNALAGPVGPMAGVAPVARTATPDAMAADARIRQEGVLNRGQAENHFQQRQNKEAITASKPAPGYRVLPDGSWEPIPGGPADQKAQMKMAGQGTLGEVVASLRNTYDELDQMGAITNPEKSGLQNLRAGAGSSSVGQAVGKAFGTQAQSLRNSVNQQRPQLLQAIMKATGMSAKQMDSNAELKLWLATATDPALDVAANRRALDLIETMYGNGPKAVNPVGRTDIHSQAEAILRGK